MQPSIQQKPGPKGGAEGMLESRVDRLLDRWVLSLEQAPQRKTESRQRAPRAVDSSDEESVAKTSEATQRSPAIAEPLRGQVLAAESVEQAAEQGPEAEPSTTSAPADAAVLSTLHVTPLGPQLVLVRMPKLAGAADASETILLHRQGSVYLHRGTRLSRGPRPVLLSLAKELGASDELAHALDFLAAWFGAPLDALFSSKEGLCWGAFRQPLDALSLMLAELQERDSSTYERLLGGFGLRIFLGSADEPPSLTLPGLPPTRSRAAGGAASTSLRLLEHPSVAALLARALGKDALLRAQVSAVLSQVCAPALSALDPEGSEALDERLQAVGTRRLLAGLVWVRLRLGTAATALLKGLAPSSAKRSGSDAASAEDVALLSTLEARLRSTDQHALADSIVFIRLSHDLAAPAVAAASTSPRSTSRKART
ncbi:MAG: hypothetical protein JNJ46_25030 [Myxococcales bacterium]|nr:hypothetical protein [Myxococcales bacterium]